jgi:hypothetical protein
MKTITEILKDKAFYISLSILILSVLLIGGDGLYAMIIISLYGFIKSKGNITTRAIFGSLLLFQVFVIIARFFK